MRRIFINTRISDNNEAANERSYWHFTFNYRT
jgi:hypothetical protein